jgi:diacylglycerol kinase family enzyme
MEKALDLLINPVQIEHVPAVKLQTTHGSFVAFNILSVGLDAYVTHMTNIMKGKTPGDSYKLWLDIACLFYDWKYKIDFFNVKAFDDKNIEILTFKERLLLLAMGASGNRSYGSQQKILPDVRNVCAVKQMSVFRKMGIKSQVKNGKHINNPEVTVFNAHRLEFSYNRPILAQMDGEAVLLQPEDFPAVMELTPPVIPRLKLI